MGTLLFILAALVILFGLMRLLYQLLRRQWPNAGRTLIFLGAFLGVYLAALVITSLVSTSPTLPLNQNKCFDEWCVAVAGVHQQAADNGSQDYAVTLKVSNTGRGRAQRPDHPHIYVVDASQHNYDVSPAGQAAYESQNGAQPAVNQLIQAGTSFTTTQVFRVPADAKAYVVLSEGGWPTYFTIGDEGSLWHKESLTPLN